MRAMTFENLQEEKQDRIRSTIQELFGTLPYGEVTVRMITEHAGIPIGSLYQYFGSKDDCYLYFQQELQRRTETEVCSIDSELIQMSTDLRAYYSETEIRFINSLYTASDEVLKKFYFDSDWGKYSINISNMQRLQALGQLPETLDLEMTDYLIRTSMFNYLVYLKQRGLTAPQDRARCIPRLMAAQAGMAAYLKLIAVDSTEAK